jgi:hypothetical protein
VASRPATINISVVPGLAKHTSTPADCRAFTHATAPVCVVEAAMVEVRRQAVLNV